MLRNTVGRLVIAASSLWFAFHVALPARVAITEEYLEQVTITLNKQIAVLAEQWTHSLDMPAPKQTEQ